MYKNLGNVEFTFNRMNLTETYKKLRNAKRDTFLYYKRENVKLCNKTTLGN